MTLLAVGSMATGVAAQEGGMKVEVAEYGSRFFPDSSMADADGNPTRGAFAYAQGTRARGLFGSVHGSRPDMDVSDELSGVFGTVTSGTFS